MSSPAFRVVRGRPTERELAALALALTGPGPDRAAAAPPRPAWLRAARVEGCGGPRIAAPADLAATRR